ncbi:MAG: hypothetical protein M3329_09900 [Pseudomonadota bacterium]|nr:hypothetical protein [Pseudomonadota bacterium]
MNLFRLYKGYSVRLRSGYVKLLRALGVQSRAVVLPYDNTNPVIYVKDDPINCYTDDYVMALASAGDIRLVGMVTSSSVAPFNNLVTPEDYERFVVQRVEGIMHAKNSGFRNIPDPVRGPKGHLEKPASGKIEDTQPLGSEGSRLVVNEAKKATSDKPLLLIVCTGLTVAADAYLLEPSIADKVVVAWLGGRASSMADYDGWSDPWAASVVLQKLSLVQFPPWEADPHVPKSKLIELPDTPFRRWMINKQHSYWKTPTGQLQPGSSDGDAPPVISAMRKDYVMQAKRVSFRRWTTKHGHQLPVFKKDPNGKALVVTCADRRVATEEWWRALKNPAAYKAL